MYQQPEEYPYQEYSGQSRRRDYAHPDYYQQGVPQAPEPAQEEQVSDPYTAPNPYSEIPTYTNDYYQPSQNPYQQMTEYRGPQSIEAYNIQTGTEQPEGAKVETGEPEKKRKGLAGIGGSLVALGAWLLKLKGLLFLFKFGMFGFSALISIFVYSLFFGWRFAVGIVVLLFLHEMGHALVMKLKGIPIGGLVFIPLAGAAVSMSRMPQNARDEAEVGIAGPLAGAIVSSFCLFMAYLPGADRIWAPLAYFGFFINLFNLVPVVPFDGGRVLAAIDRRVWVLGFIALLGFQIWQWLSGNFSIFLLLFVIIAGTQLWSRRAAAQTPELQSYYNVPVSSRIILSLLYFGLAAVLFMGMSMSHALIPIAHGLQ